MTDNRRSLASSDERKASTWLFNTWAIGQYGRIGELALETFSEEGLVRGNDIYVVSADGGVWTRPFWTRRRPWRQIVDHELEALVGQLSG